MKTAIELAFASALRSAEVWSGMGARGINEGFCGDFADDLSGELDLLGEVGVQLGAEDVIEGGTVHGEHYWVWYRGRHYDSEAPTGVLDWIDLPHWRRVRGLDLEPGSIRTPRVLPRKRSVEEEHEGLQLAVSIVTRAKFQKTRSGGTAGSPGGRFLDLTTSRTVAAQSAPPGAP